MTPELRDLLTRHPAPWVIVQGLCDGFDDANGVRIGYVFAEQDEEDYGDLAKVLVALVNAEAASMDAWEKG